MGCCGKARRAARKAAKQAGTLPGISGLVLLEFVGNDNGKMWYGSATGTGYAFSDARRVGYVDKRDARALLGLEHEGEPVFVKKDNVT